MHLIRTATQSDVDGLVQLLHEIDDIGALRNLAVAQTRVYVARALATATATETSVIIVGVADDGTVIGYCSVHWVPFLFFAGPEAYITELFIRPTARGAGLGAALLQDAETRARERGCTRLSLLNGRDSQSYQRSFYAKQGWLERDGMANFVRKLD
jgi:GNAT superfamily N-acetyltransferase